MLFDDDDVSFVSWKDMTGASRRHDFQEIMGYIYKDETVPLI